MLAAPCEILPVVMTLWLPLRCTTRQATAEGLSRAQILRSIDDSLRRLNMDYVDLLQIHRWDYNTPIEETLEALNDVVKAGKARYIGASSMHASQFARALDLGRSTAGRALSPCRITTT